MKTLTTAAPDCNNYQEWTGPEPAKKILLYLCEKRGLLRYPATFILVYEIHSADLRLYWNRNCLPELVILSIMLHDLGFIRVCGNHGFWSVLQKHLVDFDGEPITTDLAGMAKKMAANPCAYNSRRQNVSSLLLRLKEKMIENKLSVHPSAFINQPPLYPGFAAGAF